MVNIARHSVIQVIRVQDYERVSHQTLLIHFNAHQSLALEARCRKRRLQLTAALVSAVPQQIFHMARCVLLLVMQVTSLQIGLNMLVLESAPLVQW